MSKNSTAFSSERRLYLAFVLSFLALLGYRYFYVRAPSKTSQGPAQHADLLHKYIWKDPSGNVYLAYDSNGKLPARQSFDLRSDLTAVPTDVTIPSTPREGFARQVFQLERQQRVEVAITDSPATRDFLIGETHLGKSQLQVARTLCRLLRDFEVDAIFVEQPDDLHYDWAHFRSLEQHRNEALAALQYRMVQDARADLAPFLPYLKDAKTDADDQAAISKIERDFGPSARAQLQAAMDTEERYEKSQYVSATDYIYIALHLEGVPIPFHNLESRQLRDQFNAHAAHASSIEDLRPEIAARDEYSIQNSRRLITTYGYHDVIWVVGAEHLKNLERMLSADGDRVEVAYNSLATASSQPKIKKEMISLVNPDELVRFADTKVPSEFQQNEDFSIPQGPSQQLNNVVASALARSDLRLEEDERAAVQKSFAQQYEAQRLRTQQSWLIKVSVRPGGTVEITRVKRDWLQIIRQLPVTVHSQGELTSIAPGFSVIDSELGQRLSRINAQQHYVTLFTVRHQGTGYAVYANEQPFYEGDDIPELVRRLNEQSGSGQVSTIYLQLDGFAEKEASGFETSVRIQQKVVNNDRNVGVLTRSVDEFFAPAQLDVLHEPELTVVQTGPLKDFTRMTLKFIARIGEGLVQITVIIYAKTAELAEELYARLRALFSGPQLSLADAVTLARVELKKKHQLSNEDLTILFRSEVGGTLVVEVPGADAARG